LPYKREVAGASPAGPTTYIKDKTMDIITVSYDYDYKWIIEAMNNGEMEFATGDPGSDAYLSMKNAVMRAFEIAEQRKCYVMLYSRVGKHVFTKTWDGRIVA
jgi:hypothetical protein